MPEQERCHECVRREAQLDDSVLREGIDESVYPSSGQPRPQGQPSHEDRQHRGHCQGRGPEFQGQGSDPADLVHQGKGPREKEEREDQRSQRQTISRRCISVRGTMEGGLCRH